MKFPKNTWFQILLFWRNLKLKGNYLNQLPIYQEARTRILLWYLALMFLFTTIAIPLIRYRLIAEVNARVKADLREDLEDFEEELIENLLESKLRPKLEQTGTERANQDIYRAFDKFLSTNKAEDDNYFITIVDGLFYKSNALFLPEEIEPNSPLMQHWQQITEEQEGEIKVDDIRSFSAYCARR
jgi:hypothetical protein